MASAFAHALAAFTIGKIYPVLQTRKFFLLGIFCAVFPDADVLAFPLGIPYESMWGHRGFTHSIFFAALLAGLIMLIFSRKETASNRRWLGLWMFFFLC